MSDLDQRIAEWRRQMLAAGIKAPMPLEELESHLRDDIEQQLKAGAGGPTAFAAAVSRIGQAGVLKYEFAKVAETLPRRVQRFIFTFAGIPNDQLAMNMNASNSNLEPRWATYLKATAFLGPALGLWALSAVFLIPKLQQICVDANLFASPPTTVWNLTHLNIGATLFFKEHSFAISVALLLVLGLLEWRSCHWPRYRRGAIGCGVFLLNSLVLLSIFMMIVTAVVAAPALLHPAH